jgi:hypothetical protein
MSIPVFTTAAYRETFMRKTGMTQLLFGALAGVAVLAGCDDNGRSWAMTAPDDYMSTPSPDANDPRDRGSTTGLPRHLPEASPASRDTDVKEGSASGGAGILRATSPGEPQGQDNDLWLKQDFRTPFPPAGLEARVAQELGTGKPLQANAKGVWVQGLYAVELGSGITQAVAPESASFQPQPPIQGPQSTPQEPPRRP